MGPIEVYFITLMLVFGIVGLVRGFLRELGVTITLLLAMYILADFGDLVFSLSNRVLRFEGTPREDLAKFNVVLIIMLVTAFISYEGETLAFGGTPPRGFMGRALNFGSGLFNGYLLWGTIWYYLDVLDYPVRKLGLFTPPLSSFAKTFIQFLPQNLPPEGLAGKYFLALAVFLIFLRVIR